MSELDRLQRFVDAQRSVYASALRELRAGRKETHWMWFIFPQVAGLGSSSMAARYAIRSRAEAQAYLNHPTLGPRLRECAEALLAIDQRSAREIMGTPDDLKLRSSMSLFQQISPPGSPYERVLAKYFGGAADERTLAFLANEGSAD